MTRSRGGPTQLFEERGGEPGREWEDWFQGSASGNMEAASGSGEGGPFGVAHSLPSFAAVDQPRPSL